MNGVWRRRMTKKIKPEAKHFMSSLEADRSLIRYDIAASIAHVRMLGRQRILASDEVKRLIKGLKKIYRRHQQGRYRMSDDLEDVHMNIEHSLGRSIGRLAHKLHTARSRNDLVAADLRLFARDKILSAMQRIIGLENVLLKNAAAHKMAIIPGYTHLQPAQPVLWSFYLLSHFAKFQRDFQCLQDCLPRINVSPLGCSALAGTAHRIDPEYTARRLRFTRFCGNALDGVSDRDYLCETMFYFNQIMLHIATLAEDIIIFSTSEFKLLEIDDSIATGSSIMPQKKNPDVGELLRAKTAKTIGALVSMLVMLKGLPSSYNRDLQEVKRIFIEQCPEVLQSLEIMGLAIAALRPRRESWSGRENMMCATDLVDYLVKDGMAFRRAYELVAEWVKKSGGDPKALIELGNQNSNLGAEVIADILKPVNSIRAKVSKNSTSLRETDKAFTRAKIVLRQNRAVLRRLTRKFSNLEY